MTLNDLLDRPDALATVGVVIAAAFALAGSLVTLMFNRKRRVDRLREALTADTSLLEKLPKGSEAYRVMRELIDHSASRLAMEQRRQSNDYFMILAFAMPMWLFAVILTATNSIRVVEHPAIGIPLVLVVVAYTAGRIQSWLIGFVSRERAAVGLPPWQNGILTLKTRALGTRLFRRLATRRAVEQRGDS